GAARRARGHAAPAREAGDARRAPHPPIALRHGSSGEARGGAVTGAGLTYAALATARHGAPAEQASLAEDLIGAPASTWRGEILRALYEGALGRGDATL